MTTCSRLQLSSTIVRFMLLVVACVDCFGQVYQYGASQPAGEFMWGVATSAYEIEGAALEDGKGPSVWDTFNGAEQISCDSYHKYEEDVYMLRQLGVHHYRFSIAWSRILPRGTLELVNFDGIRYYRALIDELTRYGIQPFVTLYHFDLPQSLEDRGGWLNATIIEHFNNYANLCFDLFGDKVKYWVTINEPGLYSKMAYEFGAMLPRMRGNGTLLYESAHNMLLAHATAYRTYEKFYREKQRGQVGVALEIFWPEPEDLTSDKDRLAAQRSLDFEFGWFADPLIKTGDYPEIMKERIGENSRKQKLKKSRLPVLLPHQQKLVKGAYDFIGLNMYSSHLISHKTYPTDQPSFLADRGIALSVSPKWPQVLPWLCVTPFGLRKSLMYIREMYDNPAVFVLENGIGDVNGSMADQHRISYHSQYIDEMMKAIQAGCDVRGYTAWTLMDSFNYLVGYRIRFGFYAVNFTDPARKRTPKLSARWYASFIRSRRYLTPRTGTHFSQMTANGGQQRPSCAETTVSLFLLAVLLALIHRNR